VRQRHALRATGLARVKVTQGQVESILALPIKSVDIVDVQDLVAHLQPAVPTTREFNKQTKRWETLEKPYDPDYLKRQTEYTRALARAWVFMAVDLDVQDAEGRVVWSADNSVRHLSDTEAAYKAMGMTDSQLTDILAAVRKLTTLAEEQLDRD